MGCTLSHQSSLDSVQDPASLSSYTPSSSNPSKPAIRSGGYANGIAGTRREGVCWCGNFCGGMIQDTTTADTSARSSCCLHDNSGSRRWTKQMCELCRYRQKEARVEKVQSQLGSIKRQIYVANGIYRNKKACCGLPCQILSCNLCCYHVKPPNKLKNYCSMCRDREISPSNSQELKAPGKREEVPLLFCQPCHPPPSINNKNQQETSKKSSSPSSSSSFQQEDECLFPTVVEEECPICLEDLPIDELCRLPCGHMICRRPGCGMAALAQHQDDEQKPVCCPLCRDNVPGSSIILMAIDAWTKKVENRRYTCGPKPKSKRNREPRQQQPER